MTERRSSWISLVEPVSGDSEIISRVQELTADLRPDNADLLPALHRIQNAYGYVPKETIPVLAAKFRTTPALVFGSITFYAELRTSPPPEVEIEWCSGPACRLKGSENIRRAMEAVLGVRLGDATPDNAIGLRLVQCDGTCHLAPLVRLDHRYIGPLSVSDAIRLARKLKEKAGGQGTL
ncbi:MAG: NAD(P)H-dependent oxidoreductase subunit E [Dehalococcoidia bacterium]